MKIKEVMDITGLTRKAIKYYEQEELISPAINADNNYREYSKEDVNVLIQISLLRQLNIPIKDIKYVLNDEEKLESILKEQLMKVNETLKLMQRNRSLIEEILYVDKKLSMESVTDKLFKLQNILDMEDRKIEGYVKRQLVKIFPDGFGQMLAVHYASFLNEPINTKEKVRAWMDMIEFLDKIDIDFPQDLKNIYEMLSSDDFKKYEKNQASYVNGLIESTDEEVEERKRKIEEHLEENSEGFMEFQNKYSKSIRELKEQLLAKGFYEKVPENLKILSRKYAQYQEKLKKFG